MRCRASATRGRASPVFPGLGEAGRAGCGVHAPDTHPDGTARTVGPGAHAPVRTRPDGTAPTLEVPAMPLGCRSPNLTRSVMSGGSCATTGARTVSSEAVAMSPIIAAELGTDLSRSRSASHRSENENRLTGSEPVHWYDSPNRHYRARSSARAPGKRRIARNLDGLGAGGGGGRLGGIPRQPGTLRAVQYGNRVESDGHASSRRYAGMPAATPVRLRSATLVRTASSVGVPRGRMLPGRAAERLLGLRADGRSRRCALARPPEGPHGLVGLAQD